MEKYFFLLNQEQFRVLLNLLTEFYFDDPEIRQLLRAITSQLDTRLEDRSRID